MEKEKIESSEDIFEALKDKGWEKVYYPIYRFFKWHVWYPLRYNFKYFLQRHFRGWSDEEAWDLSHHVCQRFIKPLKHMRANLHGYPYRVGMKRWKEILDQIIWSFEYHLEDKEQNCYDPKTKTCDQERLKKELARCQKGFELFGKHFMHLWD